MKKIAALFVMPDGPYYGLDNVEPWGLPDKDARNYNGPCPVVAHPPCARWGRYWGGGPMLAGTPKAKKLGDDDGCFESALNSVRKYGGVLEHPEASHAWKHFGIARPHHTGGWIEAGDGLGFTCCVEQGHYGHFARKKTWLYVVNTNLPRLYWGPSVAHIKLDEGYHSKEERRKAKKLGVISRLTKKEREATPKLFRDLLIDIAMSAAK